MRILLEDYNNRTCIMEATMMQQVMVPILDTSMKVCAIQITNGTSDVAYILGTKQDTRDVLYKWAKDDAVAYLVHSQRIFINPKLSDYVAMKRMVLNNPEWFDVVDYSNTVKDNIEKEESER